MRGVGSLAAVLLVCTCLISAVLPGNALAQSAADDASFEVQCPQSGYVADPDAAAAAARLRSVRITIDTPGLGYQQSGIQQDLLRAGAQAAWAQCPITMPLSGTTFTTEAHGVGSAEIYGVPEEGGPLTLLLRATSYAPYCLCWEHVEDVYAAQQQAATQQAAQEQAAAVAQQQAAQVAAQNQIAQQQVAAQAAQQAQQFADDAARKQAWDQWWDNVWSTIKTLVLLAIGVWLATKWETFVRWYSFREMARRIGQGPDWLVQDALAAFIEEHAYAMQVKKVRAAYAERLQLMTDACRTHLPGITLAQPQGGLHLVLHLGESANDRAICERIAANGLAVSPLSHCYMQPGAARGLVLGFGGVPERLVEPIIRRLAELMR